MKLRKSVVVPLILKSVPCLSEKCRRDSVRFILADSIGFNRDLMVLEIGLIEILNVLKLKSILTPKICNIKIYLPTSEGIRSLETDQGTTLPLKQAGEPLNYLQLGLLIYLQAPPALDFIPRQDQLLIWFSSSFSSFSGSGLILAKYYKKYKN